MVLVDPNWVVTTLLPLAPSWRPRRLATLLLFILTPRPTTTLMNSLLPTLLHLHILVKSMRFCMNLWILELTSMLNRCQWCSYLCHTRLQLNFKICYSSLTWRYCTKVRVEGWRKNCCIEGGRGRQVWGSCCLWHCCYHYTCQKDCSWRSNHLDWQWRTDWNWRGFQEIVWWISRYSRWWYWGLLWLDVAQGRIVN